MHNYKYKEILEEEVLNTFTDKQRKEIGDLILGQNYGFFIDVKKICKILDIKIEEGKPLDNLDINESGKYIAETKTILFDPNEQEIKQRFTITHQLYRAIFGQKEESFKSQISEKYHDVISKMYEINTNHFTFQLLMPVKLIKILMLKSINKHEYNSECLSHKEFDIIVGEVAKELKVSEIALKYNLIDNGLIS